MSRPTNTSATRINQVQAPVIPIVAQWVAEHPGTISLGQGVVHYAPPPSVAEAVAAAANGDPATNRYGLVAGKSELRSAFENKVARDNGLAIDGRSSIVVTAGSNMGFINAILAIADIDDEIVLLSPFYFNHEMAVEIAGCRPVVVPTDANYQIDVAAIESAITSRTRAIVTISPNNPTGAVYSAESLTAVNRLCQSRGLYHISDEAYEYFVYKGATHFSPAALPDSALYTISLYSLSKSYAMAGWRIGCMVLPSHLETAVKKIQDTNLICPPIICQVAAIAALQAGAEWCAEQIAGFSEIRAMVLEELAKLGDRCRTPEPEGAFYALIQLDTDRPDMELVKALIRDDGIAVMPGTTFGVADGCSLRIAFGALDGKTVVEGMGRLIRGLQRLL